MAQKVASVYGEIDLRDNATHGLATLSSSLRNAGDAVQGLGAQLSMLAVPIGLIGAQGINVASSFEQAIVALENFGGLAGDELSAVTDEALRLGAVTMYSATDAANAMLELVKSGQSVETAMQNAGQAMTLAAISGMELADAAGVLSAGLSIFNLDPMQDGARVVQALAGAANASRANIDDLGDALTNVGPVAAQMGLSIEDTAAILGVFANNGVMGAEAGTQLRSMLIAMTQDTGMAQEGWAALGVDLYSASGEMRNLNDVLEDMIPALAAMSDEERNNALHSVAGSYGVVGLNALIAAGGIDEMLAAMDAAPPAAELAASAMTTFRGRLEGLRGSVEALAITALTPLMENTLAPLLVGLTDVANAVTAWAAANPVLATQIATIAGGLTVLAPTLLVIGGAIKLAALAVGGLTAAFALLLSPIGLAIGLAAALVTGYVTNFGGLRDFIDNEVAPRLHAFFDFLAGLWEQVGPALEQFAAGFGASMSQVFDDLQAVINKVGELVAAIQNIPNVIAGIQDNASAIGGMVATGQVGVGDVINAAVGAIGAEFAPRAAGGPVTGGSGYLVGEVGPELFVPGRSGTIIPNHALGGGGDTVNVYLTAYGSSPHELYEMIRRAARERGV